MTTTTKTRRRIVSIIATLPLAMITLAAGPAGAASRNSSSHVSDVITVTSRAFLTPPQAGPGHFVEVSDTCVLKSDTEAAIPCTLVASGTVTPTGGQARGIVTSGDGVVILNETYVFTGPTTVSGTGSVTEIATNGTITTGTFTANFVTGPTGNPNVLQDDGTITVIDVA